MDPWANDLSTQNPHDDIFASGNEQYLNSLLMSNFEQVDETVPKSQHTHQRVGSAAYTMHNPLYQGASYFDTQSAYVDEHSPGSPTLLRPEPIRRSESIKVKEELDLLATVPEAASMKPRSPKRPLSQTRLSDPSLPSLPAMPVPQPSHAVPTPATPSSVSGSSSGASGSSASGVGAAATAPTTPAAPSGRRRITKEQAKILEDSFQRNTHLDKAERERVCRLTGLMPKNVNIWFQNRRQKAKSQAKTPDKPSVDIVKYFAGRDKESQPPIPPPPSYYNPAFQAPNKLAAAPQMSPTFQDACFGLGAGFEPPVSPSRYSPGSNYGDCSPQARYNRDIQYQQQHMYASKMSGVPFWDSPAQPQENAMQFSDPRASSPRGGLRKYGLMQSPQLAPNNGASYSTGYLPQTPRQPSIKSEAMLARSKSAVAIASNPDDEDYSFSSIKRRRSNFSKYSLGTPIQEGSTAASTPASQMSPAATPPTEPRVPTTPFEAVGAAQAHRMMATRARSYTQPSIRYDKNMRLQLDDQNHQAVLYMVDNVSNSQTPVQANRPQASLARNRSTTQLPQQRQRPTARRSSSSYTAPAPQSSTDISSQWAPHEFVGFDPRWSQPNVDDVPEENCYFNFPSSDT